MRKGNAMKIFELITLPALLAALVLATNVFTEIIKRLVTVKQPQRLVVAIACILSVGAAIVAIAMQCWTLPWQIACAVLAGLLIGGLIAYGAMFGYDDLYKQAVGILGSLVTYLWKNAARTNPSENNREVDNVSQPRT